MTALLQVVMGSPNLLHPLSYTSIISSSCTGKPHVSAYGIGAIHQLAHNLHCGPQGRGRMLSALTGWSYEGGFHK